MRCSAIGHVQANRVFDVIEGLFVRRPLRVAALQGGTVGEVAVPVFLNNDFDQQFIHNKSIPQ